MPYIRPNAHDTESRKPPIFATIALVSIDAFDVVPTPSTPPPQPTTLLPGSKVSSCWGPCTQGRLHASGGRPTSTSVDRTLPHSLQPPCLQASPAALASGRRAPTTPQLRFTSAPPAHPHEVLGGSALYSIVGARIWLPPRELRALVDRAPGGVDLPRDAQRQMEEYGTEIWSWNETEDTRMARARIRYDGDVRLYQSEVKPPLRTMTSLLHTPLRGAEYLHIASHRPEDVHALLCEIASLLDGEVQGAWRPRIIFEPAPPSCHSGQRECLEQILSGVDVISPNHEELLSFYSYPPLTTSDPAIVPIIETLTRHLLGLGVGKDGRGTVVIRCSRLGCCVGTKQRGLKWIPAYFAGEDAVRVKDVTGAGNAFLGGFAAGLNLSGGDPYEAALFGTVSAGFVIEQMGSPEIAAATDERVELWNGDEPMTRLRKLKERVASAAS